MNDTDLALYTMELAEPNSSLEGSHERMVFVGYQTRDGKYHIHCPNFIDEVDNKLYWKDDRGDYNTRTDYPLLTDVRDCKKENKLDTIISLLTSIDEKLSTKEN